MNNAVEFLARTGIIPVVVLEDAQHAVPLGHALANGGLPSAEVTMRTPAALDAMRALSDMPGMVIGAGTVVEPSQVAAAIDAGAQYIVSPGFSPAISRECEAQGIPLVPGVTTPTEVMAAMDAGHTVLKFFPAGASGGPAMVAALAAPFPAARFVPTGGITVDTARDYLALPSVLAVGGTWIASRSDIASGRFEAIAENAAAAVALVKEKP